MRSSRRSNDKLNDNRQLQDGDRPHRAVHLGGKQFKLIYRATRDGFQAHFHAKCDNQPNTLTIIKTANGFVFDGYAAVALDSTSGWKRDKDAFIFSLINAKKVSLLIPSTTNSQVSVKCDAKNGPSFSTSEINIRLNYNQYNVTFLNCGGSFDFTIFSNGTVSGHSNLNRYSSVVTTF